MEHVKTNPQSKNSETIKNVNKIRIKKETTTQFIPLNMNVININYKRNKLKD